MSDNNVTASKPNNTAGAVFGAPAGTAVPTTAVATLNAAFKKLGYVSEDGVGIGTAMATTNIKEWGGGVVMVTQDEKTETYKMKMIEYLNLDLQRFVHGDDNVTVNNDGSVAIAHGDEDVGEKALVINYYIEENRKARMVIPRCKITAIGDVNHKINEPVAYDLTITAIKDSNGKGAYDYWDAPASSGATGATGTT